VGELFEIVCPGKAGGCISMIEYLPSMCEVLGWILELAKKKKKRKTKKKEKDCLVLEGLTEEVTFELNLECCISGKVNKEMRVSRWTW
jgi:hypothetical protein